MPSKKGKSPGEQPPAPPTREAEPQPAPGDVLEATLASPAPPVPVGGYVAASETLPVGLMTGALADANAADNARRVAPTFGEVLKSIGMAVAETQTALDKSLVESAQALSETTIDVVTDVVQHINEDGRPSAEDSEVVVEKLSLANFVTPVGHVFEHMAISMDLSVGEMSASQGFTFNQQQTSVSAGGWFTPIGWFAGGSARFNETDLKVDRSQESVWASGQVRMDTQLRARPTDRLPVGADLVIGPSFSYALGETKETRKDGVTRRTTEVIVEFRTTAGAPNPNKDLEVEVDPFAFTLASSGDFNGHITNAKGQIKLLVSREVAPGNTSPIRGSVRVRKNDLFRKFDITL